MVSPLRPTDPDGRRSMPGLSSGTDRIGPVGVRVPRTGSRSGSPPEVLRVARRGEALAAAVAALGPPPADAVTWVPLAPRRRAERGFDQARVLARALARELDLPAAAFVRRTKATAPQARRTRDQRLEAMKDAFACIPQRPVPARVLLVDDVLTTGATASACAAALLEGGAREIHLLTACRSFNDRPPGPRGSRHP